ncbi:hypothetical protein JXI42_13145 [bacterium]|nr:hypothetical protein [bacterium]
MLKIKISVLVFLLFKCSALVAEPFEFPPPLPQVGALGGITTCLEGNLSGSVGNPASLADWKSYGIALAYSKLYNQSFLGYTTIASGIKLPRYGTLGMAYRDVVVKYQEVVLTNEQTFTFSHGFIIMQDIHSSLDLGYALNIYTLQYAESVEGRNLGSSYTFGFNIGAQARIYDRTYVGLFMENVNSPKIGDEFKESLPQRLKLGLGYEPYDKILTLFEVEKEHNHDIQMRFGIEVKPYEELSLRVGGQNRPEKFSVGFGVNIMGTVFDYSLQTHPVLPLTHHFMLAFSLSGGNSEE